MDTLIYLAAGYAVFWLISFGFIYSISRRQRRLQQELKMLEQLVPPHKPDQE